MATPQKPTSLFPKFPPFEYHVSEYAEHHEITSQHGNEAGGVYSFMFCLRIGRLYSGGVIICLAPN
jgi:hypothetical protein